MNERENQKEKIAAAIEYKKDVGIPQLVAKGRGSVAERIIEKAKEENITTYEDKELANLLNNLNIGDNIPESLYDLTAQILIYVSSIDKKVKEKLENN